MDESVSFPGWREALAKEALIPQAKQAYVMDILGLLRACKSTRRPLSAGFIRWHLARPGLTEEDRQEERTSFRWLFKAARAAGKTQPMAREFTPPVETEPALAAGDRRRFEPPATAALPPLAAADLGGADWERALVSAIRCKGFLWRTEKTYREWAARFAVFLAPRSPYAAAGPEVAEFLSMLAVQRRASASTQKQALNALVFLMQEALRVNLGEFDFRRSQARRRMPTVLSKDEVRMVLEQMPGGYRLMGEVMYGSGLRLMELLRLRVHHLDLARGQVKVYAGKGDRVNGFANAAN